jgi:putative iron-dependent peroxidase
MLERMFFGDGPARHDRILDFSTAHTGTSFFIPSSDFLDDLPKPASSPASAATGPPPDPDRPFPATLGIGDLKGRDV